MGKSAACVLKIVALLLILTTLFSSVYLNRVENQKPLIYIISMQKVSQSNAINSVNLVNKLLYLNENVYILAAPLAVSIDGVEYTLANGDFIIPFHKYPQSVKSLYSNGFQNYFEKLSEEFSVPILKMHGSIEARVYPLKRSKVAVLYAGGVTGGALEHIHTLEEAGFSLGLISEEDLSRGDLSEYDVITFPGGGPYRNYMSEEARENIRDFVKRGGGYLGTCGGSSLGMELGLLDAEAAMAGPDTAYADFRGPLLLNLTESPNPIVLGYSSLVECIYFRGPFISKVGSDVTTIGAYYSKTENLSLYFPEIAKAYNLTPQTQVINNFWGSPAIIAGKYGSGKVVLSTVHPEILPISQRLFINFILYLSSCDEITLKTSQYPSIQKSSKSYLGDENLDIVDKTLWSQARNLTSTLEECSSDAQEVLQGLEESNYQLIGSSGEYLMLYLNDINTRSTKLLARLEQLRNVNENFESLKTILNNKYQPYPTLSLINRDLLLSIESLQKRIQNIQHKMSKAANLTHMVGAAKNEILDEALLLQQILSEDISSSERYQKIIDLNAAETLTMCKLKDDVDYHLLNWTFTIESILIEASLLKYVIEDFNNVAS